MTEKETVEGLRRFAQKMAFTGHYGYEELAVSAIEIICRKTNIEEPEEDGESFSG